MILQLFSTKPLQRKTGLGCDIVKRAQVKNKTNGNSVENMMEFWDLCLFLVFILGRLQSS